MALHYYVDWENTGTYAGTYDDITADVQGASWEIGMKESFQEMADEAACTLTLKNTSGRYTPENTLSPITGKVLPNRRVKIEADTSGGAVRLFTGMIEAINPAWEPAGELTGKLTVELTCVGFKAALENTEVPLRYYTNMTGDRIILDVIQSAQVPAFAGGIWILGMIGNSELSVNTYLGTVASFSDLDSGIQLFPYFGDGQLRDAYGVIEEITMAERGRFFQGRDGKAYWWNRHHLQNDLTSDATVSSTGTYRPVGLDYGYGRLLRNSVRVTAYQRTVEVSTETLWTLVEPITIPNNSQRMVEVTLRRDNGQFASCGALTVTGATYSEGTCTITVQERGGKAILTLLNETPNTAILTALQVTGAPTITQNDVVAVAVDGASIQSYGRRELQMDLQALNSFDMALNIAQFELGRRILCGDIQSVTFKTKADGVEDAHMIAWGMGTRLTLDFPELGHNAPYFVIGESHAWSVGNIHEATFYTEPADTQIYWLVGETGFSEMGETTTLGY